MTSYDNEYNRSLRNKVMGLDVANIGNDKMNAAKTPLHQGGAGKKQRRKDASLLEDVDFRRKGLRGEGFFDDLLDGLSKAGQVAHQSIDLYDKVNKSFGKNKGMGMSGGVRRGAEMSDVMAPQGRTGQMLAVAPIKKGSKKGSALLAGSGKLHIVHGGERMTGDNYTPSWRQIEAEQAKSGFIGNGLSGGDFFSDLLSGINSVAGVVGPIAQIAGKFGAGKKKPSKRLAAKIAALHGRGAGTYGMPALLGMEGSGPISDLGIPGLSQIAGLFGLGMSGGAADGAQDPAFAIPAPSGEALATAFLGGRHPSKVSKAEKKMLFLKALADAKMHHELGNMMQGRGMSGGADSSLVQGLGLSGGDFFSDLIGTIGNVAQTAAHIAPLVSKFGMGYSGGAYEPMREEGISGGGLTDMPSLNARAARHSYGKMANIAGMANGAGKPSKKVHGGYLPAPPTQVGVSMSGMGEQSESESEEEEEDDEDMEGGERCVGGADRQVGCGVSGGKKSWLQHVKDYQKKHGCSYKEALKRAGASYRGKGMSGGDFISDLGNVASTVAPFLPFLL